MSRVPPSSNADAVKQGLQLIEQVHQLGSDALQLRSTDLPTTGSALLSFFPHAMCCLQKCSGYLLCIVRVPILRRAHPRSCMPMS